MSKTEEQLADDLVEMYSWIPSDECEGNSLENAISAAILHTQGIIANMQKLDALFFESESAYYVGFKANLEQQEKIKTILNSRL